MLPRKEIFSLSKCCQTETDHLEESKICVSHVVKCYLGVDPGVILLETFPLIVNHTHGESGVVLVNTFVELPAKELNSHDGKYQPEDEADQQDIDDGGDGVHQGIYDNLEEVLYYFIIIPSSALNKLAASVLENFMASNEKNPGFS